MYEQLSMEGQSPVVTGVLEAWSRDFQRALSHSDLELFRSLVDEQMHWRDIVAMTGNVENHVGRDEVFAALRSADGASSFGSLTWRSDELPTWRNRGGDRVLEAFGRLDVRFGPARCLIRFRQVEGDNALRASTLCTVLDQVEGFQERVGPARPTGGYYSQTFGGDNWRDLRVKSQEYRGRNPEVLVVGAGQAGLATAARLQAMGVDTLVVETKDRVGDNWRDRYHSLTLHNEVWVNHLPFMPFPSTWPQYTPKDLLGDWFEAYARAMELNVWTRARARSARFDPERERWEVDVVVDGQARALRPRHVVMAVGLSGRPRIPRIPGVEEFRGRVAHSGSFVEAHEYAGRNCVVFGTGTSGHDVAQELLGAGARSVAILQRDGTAVISLQPSSRLVYGMYEEGHAVEDADLIVQASGSYHATHRSLQALTKELKQLDADLLARLERVGFYLDFGEDDTGHQMKQLQSGGGFYINVGASDLIAEGKISLLEFKHFVRLVPDGLLMSHGETHACDLVVLATGYEPLSVVVAEIFGPDVAEKIGPIWGFGEDGELRNMWRATPVDNLWFAGGSFSQCRMYSKAIAQQVALAGVQRDTDPHRRVS